MGGNTLWNERKPRDAQEKRVADLHFQNKVLQSQTTRRIRRKGQNHRPRGKGPVPRWFGPERTGGTALEELYAGSSKRAHFEWNWNGISFPHPLCNQKEFVDAISYGTNLFWS